MRRAAGRRAGDPSCVDGPANALKAAAPLPDPLIAGHPHRDIAAITGRTRRAADKQLLPRPALLAPSGVYVIDAKVTDRLRAEQRKVRPGEAQCADDGAPVKPLKSEAATSPP